MFGGPPVIKKLISVYSDGALMPSGVTVSPRLSVGISRLEFNIQNKIDGWHIEGFSRAAELGWSFFGNNPFLELNLGPTVVKNYATADSVNLFTPSFKKIDWQNIGVVANIDALNLIDRAKIDALELTGDLNLKIAQVSNVKMEAEQFSAKYGNSTYSFNLLRGDLSKFDFNAPLDKQLILSTFAMEDIMVSEPNLSAPEAIIKVSVEQEARNFKFDAHNIQLSDFGGAIKNLKVDGRFNDSNVVQELNLVLKDIGPHKKLPKFPEVSANARKLGDGQYQVFIEGRSDEFELSNSKSYFGALPRANFTIDLELDRYVAKVASISKINFSALSEADIDSTVEVDFVAEHLTNSGCAFWDCKLSDFNLSYKVNFDDEWVNGTAYCREILCILSDMEHLVRTSNTVNIFTILNQANILNPLSSLYLFGAISSGKKINEGHELKFQF